MARDKRTNKPIIPIIKVSGDKSAARAFAPAARAFLFQANNIFGKNRQFNTYRVYPDGTVIQARKINNQHLVYITAPEFIPEVVTGDCLLDLVLVPQYDHTKGLTINPYNNFLAANGQNRGVMGHYSIGDLTKLDALIPNEKFKIFRDPPIGIVDIIYSTTNFNQNLSTEISRHNNLYNNPSNSNNYWQEKEQIKLTRDFDPLTRGDSGLEYTSQTGDPDVDQVNNISQALATLRTVRAGHIDWRSLAGRIVSIKGPAGRGIPATLSSMTSQTDLSISPSLGTTAEANLFDASNKYRGASRIDTFDRFIYEGGEIVAAVDTLQVILGICIHKFFNIVQQEVEEHYVVATVDKASLNGPIGTFRESRVTLTFRSKKITEDLVDMLSGNGWFNMGNSPLYNPNYPVFFAGSGNKAITTYQDQRPGPAAPLLGTEAHRHFESFSTVRVNIIDPTQVNVAKTEEPDVEFPTVRVVVADPTFLEELTGKFFNQLGQFWIGFFKIYPSTETDATLPLTEVAFRVSSDFKYGTEQEVYIEKRISLEATSRHVSVTNLPSSVSTRSENFGGVEPGEPQPLADGQDLTADTTLTISYWQSFVGEFDPNLDLIDVSDASIGFELNPPTITSAPTTGTGILQKIGEVQSRFEVDHRTLKDGVSTFGDLWDGKMQAVSCDLRFGLALYLTNTHNYVPHTIVQLDGSTGDLRPHVSGSDYKGYLTCPGRFTVELPDIDPDQITGVAPSQAFHVGNLSYDNDIANSTRFITGVDLNVSEFIGNLDYMRVQDADKLLNNFTFDYSTIGYGTGGPALVNFSDGTDDTVTMNTALDPIAYMTISDQIKQTKPFWPAAGARADICGLYSKGQQLEYTILGLDKSNYVALTPWVEHLPGYDFDPLNDLDDPPGPKTNVSDLWEALGTHQFITPTPAESGPLGLDGDFLKEEYYKNLTVFKGISSAANNECMVFYEDSQPPSDPGPP